MPSSAPTPRQQAYLDYIAAYMHVHRRAPAEADMQHHFRVTPPSVHTMILTLERRGFIRRTPGQARSITLVPPTAPSTGTPSSSSASVTSASAPPAPPSSTPSTADATLPAATPQKAPGWTAVRPVIADWDKSALLALVKDLYVASEAARDLVNTRCRPAESSPAILEKYRQKIITQFFSEREHHGMGPLKLGEARKAIRDYRKLTGDIPSTAELLLTYVESGARFTHEYGDIDERFYNSVESTLDELAALLRGPARALYPSFHDRLARVEFLSRNIGWGFHDFVADTVATLAEELSA